MAGLSKRRCSEDGEAVRPRHIGAIGDLGEDEEMLNENEDKTDEEMQLLSQCLLCVKTIMNSQQGLHSIIEHPDCLAQILLFFSSTAVLKFLMPQLV